MANPWFRLWAEMVNDPKWRTIAKVSKQEISRVISVALHMMTCASNAEERGHIEGWSDEDVATALDIDIENVAAIRAAMAGRFLDGDFLIAWEKRQPKRERENDCSTERTRKFKAKERQGTPGNADDDQGTPREEEIREEINKDSVGEGKTFTAVDLSIAMRKAGVQTQPADPRLIQLAEQGVSPETATAACAAAKEKKPGQPVNLGYVVAILKTWAEDAEKVKVKGAAKPAKGGAWWLSYETKLAKAREVGIGEPLRGESEASWEARIKAAIDNGGKPPPPARPTQTVVVAGEPERVKVSPDVAAKRSADLKAALKQKDA